MPVAAPLLLRLVADPLVDEPLVDATRRADADERVTERMPALDDRPGGAREAPLQVVVRLLGGELGERRGLPFPDRREPALEPGRADLLVPMSRRAAPLLAPLHLAEVTEQKLPAGVGLQI